MDTNKIVFKLGFKLDGIFFAYHEGLVYQLPYMHKGRYFGLRSTKPKTFKNNTWVYYRIRRKKFGLSKLKAMLQEVNWEVNLPANI